MAGGRGFLSENMFPLRNLRGSAAQNSFVPSAPRPCPFSPLCLASAAILRAHLLKDDTLGVRRATGGRGLVELAESALVVVLVGPTVLATRGAELTGGLDTTGLVRCVEYADGIPSRMQRGARTSWEGSVESCHKGHLGRGVLVVQNGTRDIDGAESRLNGAV